MAAKSKKKLLTFIRKAEQKQILVQQNNMTIALVTFSTDRQLSDPD
jgi:hypothetical protein